MSTAVSIFQLVLLTNMLTFCCSAVDVYLSPERRTWDASHNDTNCNLANLSGTVNLNHTVPHAPALAWVDGSMCYNRKVWINMTGCFNLTSVSGRGVIIPETGDDDPVVFCLRKCDSDQVYLTSTECYCGSILNQELAVTRDSQCQVSRCGRYNDRLCGSGVNGVTKCVCGYEKTNISTNNSGNCMSTKISGGIFVNNAQNCNQQMPVLCTNSKNQHTVSPTQRTNWSTASCSTESYFIGVKNGSKTDINYSASPLWIGLFSVELTHKTCLAINITNPVPTVIQQVQQDCSQLLPSICINQTSTTSTKTLNRPTSTPIWPFQSSTPSLVTGYPSTSTPVSQSHSLPKDQASKSSSATSSLDVATRATKCDNLSSGYADHATDNTAATATSTIESTKRDPASDTGDRFPALAVGFGIGGAVVLILVLTILVVFYRRRTQNRSHITQRSVKKLYDGNQITKQTTRNTMKKDNNDHTAETALSVSVGLDDYDHLETHKNRKLSHNYGRQAGAFHDNTYDHVEHQQDGSAYNTFSQKTESVSVPGEEYDHIVRNTDLYDHIGTKPVRTLEDSNYDHTESRGRTWRESGRQSTGKGYDSNIAPKTRTTIKVHRSNKGNYGNNGGNGQSYDLNTARTRNSYDKHYKGAQCRISVEVEGIKICD